MPVDLRSQKPVLTGMGKNRYNQGNTVLGIEFGDHVGDWYV